MRRHRQAVLRKLDFSVSSFSIRDATSQHLPRPKIYRHLASILGIVNDKNSRALFPSRGRSPYTVHALSTCNDALHRSAKPIKRVEALQRIKCLAWLFLDRIEERCVTAHRITSGIIYVCHVKSIGNLRCNITWLQLNAGKAGKCSPPTSLSRKSSHAWWSSGYLSHSFENTMECTLEKLKYTF